MPVANPTPQDRLCCMFPAICCRTELSAKGTFLCCLQTCDAKQCVERRKKKQRIDAPTVTHKVPSPASHEASALLVRPDSIVNNPQQD